MKLSDVTQVLDGMDRDDLLVEWAGKKLRVGHIHELIRLSKKAVEIDTMKEAMKLINRRSERHLSDIGGEELLVKDLGEIRALSEPWK